MNKLISISAFALIITGMLCACNGGGIGGSGDSISLKFNFRKGSRYKYIIKNRQSLTQVVAGKSMNIKQDMDMESTYQVAAAEGNNRKLTVTYDRIAMSSDAGIKKTAYDSDDTLHSDPIFRGLSYMLHKPRSMTVNDKGQIVAMEGFSNLVPATGDAAPISDSSLRSMMQQAFYIYPDKPVKPGDTWANSYNTSLGFIDLHTDNTYKLISVSNGIAHIEMNSKISSQPGSNSDMKEVRMDVTGTQTGALDVEIATGMLMGSSLSQQLKGTVNMIRMDIKAPIEVNTNINIVGATEK